MPGSEDPTSAGDVTPAASRDESELYARLVADRFLRPEGAGYELEPRWFAAMARAARELNARGDTLTDLRVPVAWALAPHYAGQCSDEELVGLVVIMTRLEARLEERRTGAAPGVPV